MPESERGQINLSDLKSILVGAAIAAAGAALTVVVEWASTSEHIYAPIVFVVATVLINTLRKLLTKSEDPKEKVDE